ncbi:MAG: penicillin-binding transpeptidase domain-containing protein [Steroidobacteraceae bacterium]
MSRGATNDARSFRLRSWFVFGVLMLAAGGLLARAVDLQLVDHEFLIRQGEARSTRPVSTVANRGAILDRNDTPLAISTPVDSVWADPRELVAYPDRWPELASVLQRDRGEFARRISSNQDGKFIWLARQISREQALAVRNLDVAGVHLSREQKRYYPSGEVVGHVVGFTNVDDEGQEGAELSYESLLAGEDGLKRVIQDRRGRSVEDVENIRTTRPGSNVTLSLDMRIQNLAHRQLKAAIEQNRAHSGSMVVIDVTTGEILAMANFPTFNPNNRTKLTPAMFRNRAVTDPLEPGSSIKPFVVAAALESGHFDSASRVDVSLGYVQVGTRVIEDEHPQGILSLAGVLAKSSNVGMAMISQAVEPQLIWSTLTRLGFGRVTAGQFKGESGGSLSNYARWNPEGIASLSRGYGLSVTPLQLAQAYAAIGALGVVRPLTILRRNENEAVPEVRAISEQNARALIAMLESVVLEGTGTKAAIPGYRVAGKTGTAKKVNGSGAYYTDRYTAVFGGLAPASNPRLAAVVVIDDPATGTYYGGDVSAPVFSSVVGNALRLMGVAPDGAAGASDPMTGVSTLVRR